MNWKLKAALQSAVARLPRPVSYAVYYWIQRHFGSLSRIDPRSRLRAAVDMWRRIENEGRDPRNRTFFEVGTGRIPLVPLGFWLMGAEQTITVDLNPYLGDELVREALQYMAEHPGEVEAVFGDRLVDERLGRLLDWTASDRWSRADFLDLVRIRYRAPSDARSTRLPSDSVDFHTSYTVLEHIPSRELRQILEEGGRIVKPGGLLVHRIDYTDHFEHSDASISRINFLQYSDNEWDSLAGNRYMYMNRLRHDDVMELVRETGQRVVRVETDRDPSLEQVLGADAFHLDPRFASKSTETLITTGAWIITSAD